MILGVRSFPGRNTVPHLRMGSPLIFCLTLRGLAWSQPETTRSWRNSSITPASRSAWECAGIDDPAAQCRHGVHEEQFQIERRTNPVSLGHAEAPHPLLGQFRRGTGTHRRCANQRRAAGGRVFRQPHARRRLNDRDPAFAPSAVPRAALALRRFLAVRPRLRSRRRRRAVGPRRLPRGLAKVPRPSWRMAM